MQDFCIFMTFFVNISGFTRILTKLSQNTKFDPKNAQNYDIFAVFYRFWPILWLLADLPEIRIKFWPKIAKKH